MSRYQQSAEHRECTLCCKRTLKRLFLRKWLISYPRRPGFASKSWNRRSDRHEEASDRVVLWRHALNRMIGPVKMASLRWWKELARGQLMVRQNIMGKVMMALEPFQVSFRWHIIGAIWMGGRGAMGGQIQWGQWQSTKYCSVVSHTDVPQAVILVTWGFMNLLTPTPQVSRFPG